MRSPSDDLLSRVVRKGPSLSRSTLGIMKNPWLDIPLADDEGHMALPYVAQAELLSDIIADALGE
jgi:hypothetical protein